MSIAHVFMRNPGTCRAVQRKLTAQPSRAQEPDVRDCAEQLDTLARGIRARRFVVTTSVPERYLTNRIPVPNLARFV